MINLCWIEEGEWKKLELKYGDKTLSEVYRVEQLTRIPGSPIAFLEHPVTSMLLPLFGSLLFVRRQVKRLDKEEARMYRELARFLDAHDQSDRALNHISWQLHLAEKDARIAALETELDVALQTQSK